LLLDTSPFALQDVSLSGLGARAAQGVNEPLSLNRGVAIQLRFLDTPLFEARARLHG